MKTSPIIVESNLITKSTAQLREEIISELTSPDRSLSSLIEEIENKDKYETQDEPELCD